MGGCMSEGVDLQLGGNCEFYDTCGFFHGHRDSGEHLNKGWSSMFCDDLEMSQNCKRKKIMLETGKPPIDNMTPTGKFVV
jgi:hypothetical protein